jgi:hypothetical protein
LLLNDSYQHKLNENSCSVNYKENQFIDTDSMLKKSMILMPEQLKSTEVNIRITKNED